MTEPQELRSIQLDAEARKALEAILLVVEEPVEANTLAQVLEAPTEEVEATLRALRREYLDEGRGFVLREVAGGWRLYTDPGAAGYVEKFVLRGRSGKLSQAALETLAIVAYKQPVTRSQVSDIRGVDADGAIRSLVSRGLVEEVGREPSPGQPLLYATTSKLLEQLGVEDLSALPPLPSLTPDGPLPAEPALGGYRTARRELDALSDDAEDAGGDVTGDATSDEPGLGLDEAAGDDMARPASGPAPGFDGDPGEGADR